MGATSTVFRRVDHIVVAAAFVAVLSPCVASQTTGSARDQNARFVDYLEGTEQGTMSMKTKSSTIEWDVFSPAWSSTTTIAGSLALSIDRPGGIKRIAPRAWLVCGRKASTDSGFLYRIRQQWTPTRALVVEASKDYGTAFDPYDAAFNAVDGRLYVYDVAGKKLLSAPWSASAVFPQASSLAAIADSATFPMLGKKLLRIEAEPGGAGVRVMTEWNKGFDAVRLHHNGTGWVQTPVPIPDINAGNVWAVRYPGLLRLNSTFEMKGPQATATLVSLDTGAAMGTYAHPGGTGWHTVNWPPQMQPGHRYLIDGGGAQQSDTLVPLYRWGEPHQQGDLYVNRVSISPRLLTIGNADFPVGTVLALRPVPSAPATRSVDTWLFLNTWDGTGQAPVTQVGSGFVLTATAVQGPLNVTLTDEDAVEPFSHKFAVPNDNNLVDGIVLMQTVAIDSPTGNVSYSDVVGTSVLPTGTAASASSSSSSNRTISVQAKRKRLSKLRAALQRLRISWGSDQTGNLSAAHKAVFTRLSARIAKQGKK